MGPPLDGTAESRDAGVADAVESKSSPQELNKDPVPDVEVANANHDEDERPSLPSRPSNLGDPYHTNHLSRSNRRLAKTWRPQLQSSATTAVSRTDIHTQSYQDGSRETFAAQAKPASSVHFSKSFGSIRRLKGTGGSDADTASVKSFTPTLGAGGDVQSLLGNLLGPSQCSAAGTPVGNQIESLDPFDSCLYEAKDDLSSFEQEFDELAKSSIDKGVEGIVSSSKAEMLADTISRAASGHMEGQKEAFSHPVFRRQTYLQSTWRR